MNPLYGHKLALLTDLYQLTMACGYWKEGLAERSAVFQLTFRRCPFHGQYVVASGLNAVIEFLLDLQFRDDDLTYLATLSGVDGRPLFPGEFLEYLRGLSFRCDVDAIPEGTLVFPHEPLVRVTGPLLQAQLLETPLLTLLNFPSLIATKASRVCLAAGDDDVLEFGLRRAQGVDGGVTASRAAYVGGCAATSNVLAGKLYDVPVCGTHAHSWVMAFDDERDAFRAYAEAMPNNSIFLVDTYDSLEGVRRAIEAGRRLRANGHAMVGVRLDSGDLAALSIAARQMLDEAGFADARIVASGDLDEYEITRLKQRGARIDVWGVGTRLATAHDDPSLGGVYKLSAIRSPDDSQWLPRLKLSEHRHKVSDPGALAVRRYSRHDRWVGDVIYDTLHDGSSRAQAATSGRRSTDAHDDADEAPIRMVLPGSDDPLPAPQDAETHEVLVPVFRAGRLVGAPVTAAAARARARDQLARLPDDVRRLENPAIYPVGMEAELYARKQRLIDERLKSRAPS